MYNVLGDLNWLAIILAFIAYNFVLGFLWFTPLFGNVYDKATGVKRKKGQKWPAIYYIGPTISSVLVTVTTATLVYALSIQKLSDAVLLGLFVGVGYAASISFNNAISPVMPRPLLYGAVTGSYHVVGIVIVAAITLGLK